MLFSNPEVVEYLKANYVCAWEMVREVPKVTIDFGDGRVISRTVQGNIAFYFCNQDGVVLDIVPAINTPEAFLKAAKRGHILHETASMLGVEKTVRTYHSMSLEGEVEVVSRKDIFMSKARVEDPIKAIFKRVPKNEPEEASVEVNERMDVGKRMMERPVKRAAGVEKDEASADLGKTLSEGSLKEADAAMKEALEKAMAEEKAPSVAKNEVEIPVKKAVFTPEEWALIVEDTRINEVERMPLVHAMMAKRAGAKPADLFKDLYRDVMHCDLDDPWLGLQPDLFGHGEVNPK